MLFFLGGCSGVVSWRRDRPSVCRLRKDPGKAVTDGGGDPAKDAKQVANAARRDKMRALWADAEWRERVLAKRRSQDAVDKQAEGMSRRWADKKYREQVSNSLKGKSAWNKGRPMKEETRRKISVVMRGIRRTPETRLKMSHAKMDRAFTEESKEQLRRARKGKTKEFFRMKKEYEALQDDLKLWSDSYRLRTGRAPRAAEAEATIRQAHLLRKVKKYLQLKAELQKFDRSFEIDEPILRDT